MGQPGFVGADHATEQHYYNMKKVLFILTLFVLTISVKAQTLVPFTMNGHYYFKDNKIYFCLDTVGISIAGFSDTVIAYNDTCYYNKGYNYPEKSFVKNGVYMIFDGTNEVVNDSLKLIDVVGSSYAYVTNSFCWSIGDGATITYPSNTDWNNLSWDGTASMTLDIANSRVSCNASGTLWNMRIYSASGDTLNWGTCDQNVVDTLYDVMNGINGVVSGTITVVRHDVFPYTTQIGWGFRGYNMLTNANFETGTFTGWTNTRGNSITTTEQMQGSKALKQNFQTNFASLSQAVTTAGGMVQGKQYRAGFFFKQKGYSPPRFSFQTNGTPTVVVNTVSTKISNAQYQYYDTVFVFPANATTGTYYLMGEGRFDTNYIDSCWLYPNEIIPRKYHSNALPTTFTNSPVINGIGEGVFHNGSEASIKVYVDSSEYDIDNYFASARSATTLHADYANHQAVICNKSRFGQFKYLTLYRNPLDIVAYDSLCHNYGITVNMPEVAIPNAIYSYMSTATSAFKTYAGANNRPTFTFSDTLYDGNIQVYSWQRIKGIDNPVILYYRDKTISVADVQRKSIFDMANNTELLYFVAKLKTGRYGVHYDSANANTLYTPFMRMIKVVVEHEGNDSADAFRGFVIGGFVDGAGIGFNSGSTIYIDSCEFYGVDDGLYKHTQNAKSARPARMYIRNTYAKSRSGLKDYYFDIISQNGDRIYYVNATYHSQDSIKNDGAGYFFKDNKVYTNDTTINGNIYVYKAPTASAGTSRTVATGTTITLGGSPTASGGSSPYSYKWTPSTMGMSSSTASNPTAAPTVTTTYRVTVNDSVGCTASSSAKVTVTAGMSDNTIGLIFFSLLMLSAMAMIRNKNARLILLSVLIVIVSSSILSKCGKPKQQTKPHDNINTK